MKILLGITGSVAATLAPKMVRELTAAGHEVRVVMSFPALYFQTHPVWLIVRKVLQTKFGIGRVGLAGVPLYTDFDEWPGFRYCKDQQIPHIFLRDWADVLVVAPASADFLAKTASGICDNLLTCLMRAWDPAKTVVLAPAMNTKMWEHPLTSEHLEKIEKLYKLRIVQPAEKRLACGDVGRGAMAKIEEIVKAI